MRDDSCCNARHKTPADASRSVVIGVMYIICRAFNGPVHLPTHIYQFNIGCTIDPISSVAVALSIGRVALSAARNRSGFEDFERTNCI